MLQYSLAYAATLIALVAIDALWLGVITKKLYQQGIGHLMADKPRMGAAVVFYLLFAVGLLVFAVLPHAATPGWKKTAGAAALFGFLAYATYDLTNLTTLRDWPLPLSILDMAWGTVVSAIAAVAGKIVLDRMAAS